MGPGGPRTSWIKPSLVIFAAALWCQPLSGATNTNTREFEKPPAVPGSFEWELNQRITKERQERYRMRVPIPDAVGGNVPRSATASLVNGPKGVATPIRPAAASSGLVLQLFFSAAAFGLTGLLIVRRIAPQVLVDINQQFNPWSLAPPMQRNPSARIRAEEEAFAEFLKVFRIGPSAAPPHDLPERKDCLHEFFLRAKERLVTQRKLLQDIGRESSDPVRQRMLTSL